ncbi:hypothetical protein SODALDRAFT_360921 [Sodiomyces alkalinus F11]|uniref:Uncharacterized protein n=1 Tax=Sodiomyces alkalinus (strain CBS 110278 / VKM F-3762 / F11) TaxID=1314773 RepID=A0A3N2PRV1_SODAK|nr:hypothetical protein SODALDRAFT_360921 [Sodiomyces alkalinus F11]ROT37233.1 hypothetical protein SODALDRAFT_360921 [Sodiomyces alkalinus F11]
MSKLDVHSPVVTCSESQAAPSLSATAESCIAEPSGNDSAFISSEGREYSPKKSKFESKPGPKTSTNSRSQANGNTEPSRRKDLSPQQRMTEIKKIQDVRRRRVMSDYTKCMSAVREQLLDALETEFRMKGEQHQSNMDKYLKAVARRKKVEQRLMHKLKILKEASEDFGNQLEATVNGRAAESAQSAQSAEGAAVAEDKGKENEQAPPNHPFASGVQQAEWKQGQ